MIGLSLGAYEPLTKEKQASERAYMLLENHVRLSKLLLIIMESIKKPLQIDWTYILSKTSLKIEIPWQYFARCTSSGTLGKKVV